MHDKNKNKHIFLYTLKVKYAFLNPTPYLSHRNLVSCFGGQAANFYFLCLKTLPARLLSLGVPLGDKPRCFTFYACRFFPRDYLATLSLTNLLYLKLISSFVLSSVCLFNTICPIVTQFHVVCYSREKFVKNSTIPIFGHFYFLGTFLAFYTFLYSRI